MKNIIKNIIKNTILLFILAYQYMISPFLGTNCRFIPSCSHYACEALQKHGLLKGIILSIRRLLKCNPFARAGLDPVPNVEKY